MDAKIHTELALNFFEGHPLSKPPFFRAPLYPLFLRIIIGLFEYNPLILTVIQSLLGILSVIILSLIVYEITENNYLFLITAFISAFHWPFIYYEGEILIETFYIFLVLLFHLFIFKGLKSNNKYYILFSGFIAGLSAITRPNILIVLLAYLLIIAFAKNYRRYFSFFMIPLAAPIFVITFINYIYGKDTLLISSQAGINFYIGNNRFSDGCSAVYPEGRQDWWGGYIDSFRIAEEELNRELKPSEVSRFWFKKALLDIKSYPLVWLKTLFRKTLFFINNFEISNNSPIYYFKDLSRVMHLPLLSFGIIFTFSIVGLFFIRRYIFSTFIFSYVILYSFSVIAFFVNSRYRLPVVPFFIILAACGIYNILEVLKLNEYKIFVRYILICFISMVITFNNWYNVGPHPYEHYNIIGDIYREKNKFLEALKYYNLSLKVERYNNPAWVNLGVTLMELKNYDIAEEIFKKALKFSKKESYLYSNLGIIYYNKNDFKTSRDYFLQALTLDKNNEMSYLYLYKIYNEQNDYAQAEFYLKIYNRLSTEPYEKKFYSRFMD
ncbi:MAG: tetratricopeptide repeat protein [Candidatus Hydrogenedentota bacterium]